MMSALKVSQRTRGRLLMTKRCATHNAAISTHANKQLMRDVWDQEWSMGLVVWCITLLFCRSCVAGLCPGWRAKLCVGWADVRAIEGPCHVDVGKLVRMFRKSITCL